MNITLQTKDNIFLLIKKNHKKIKSLGVKRLGLFGSYSRNQQTEKSDIDMLVEFEHGHKNFDNFIQLAFLLEDLFQRRVELVTKEGLSQYIAPHILKEVEYAIFTS